MFIPTMASHVVYGGFVGGVTLLRCRPVVVLVLASLLPLGAGCSKKNDGPRPAAIAANPGAASTPPTPVAPVTGPPGAGTSGTPAGGTLSGRITLASERKGDVTPNDVVYLIARRIPDNPTARGSLVAVKRLSASSFPIEFTLGPGDMMFKNGAFEGDLTLAARVDKDGDPMTRRKGDVFGTVTRVKVGATGVEVKLDQLQQEDESLAGGAPPMQGGLPPGHP
jgi:hypothetical protein